MREWSAEFAQRNITPILSHEKDGEVDIETPNSLSRERTHYISVAAKAMARYPASVDERLIELAFSNSRDWIGLGKRA